MYCVAAESSGLSYSVLQTFVCIVSNLVILCIRWQDKVPATDVLKHYSHPAIESDNGVTIMVPLSNYSLNHNYCDVDILLVCQMNVYQSNCLKVNCQIVTEAKDGN